MAHLQSDLQRLLDEFRVPVPAYKTNAQKPHERSEDSENGLDETESNPTGIPEWDEFLNRNEERQKKHGDQASRNKLRVAPQGAKASRAMRALEKVPQLRILDDQKEIDEKGIRGKAAAYYKESQEIFVNGLYPSIDKMANEIQPEFINIGDDEETRSFVLTACKRSMAYRVGKGVIYAISKKLVDEWSTDDLDKATSPEALSLMADDYKQSLTDARKFVKMQARISKID